MTPEQRRRALRQRREQIARLRDQLAEREARGDLPDWARAWYEDAIRMIQDEARQLERGGLPTAGR